MPTRPPAATIRGPRVYLRPPRRADARRFSRPRGPAAPCTDAARPPEAAARYMAYVERLYLQPEAAGAGVEYHPHVVAGMEIRYTNARLAVDQARRMALAASLSDGPVALDWGQSFPVAFERAALSSAPPAGAAFAELPAAAGKPKAYEAWRKDLVRWVRQSCPLVILRSERFKLASRPDEPRAEFVARLSQAAREQRDLEVEKLRRRYADKFAQIRDRLMRAERRRSRASRNSCRPRRWRPPFPSEPRSGLPGTIGVLVAILAACVPGDWLVDRRPDRVFAIGALLIALSWPLRLWLAETQPWQRFAGWLIA